MSLSEINPEFLKRAIDRWGAKQQLGMAQEECGELIVAINKFKRGFDNEEDVIEEIADVFIMISQLALLFGHKKIDHQVSKKIERLAFRLEDEPIEKYMPETNNWSEE